MEPKNIASSTDIQLQIKSTSEFDRKLHERSYWEELKRDEFQGRMYLDIEEDFQFNVVVLGDSKVGKTSLIQSIVSDYVNMVASSDTDQMYQMIGLRKSVE